MAGLGFNTRKTQHLLRQNWRYQRGMSAEIALQINVRGKSPLGFNMELGIAHRRVEVLENLWSDDDIVYHRNGNYRSTDLYLACMPEWVIGKGRGAVFAGMFATINHTSTFKGITTSSAKPEIVSYFPPGNRRRLENGLIGGFSWRLPSVVMPSFQPSLYCRGTLGIGAVKVQAISAGMIFRL